MNTPKLQPLPFAVLDEFGQPCEDRVRDHFAAAFEALRAQIGQGDMQIRVLFECVENGVTGTTSAPVKRVEWEDDGTLTAVLDYWPPPAPQQKPLTDEQIKMAIYKQCPDFDDWHEGPSIDDVIAIVKAAHNIGEKK